MKEEILLEELRYVSVEFCDGQGPTQDEFNEFGLFTHKACTRAFGEWNVAIQEAGLEVNQKKDPPESELQAGLHRVSRGNCGGGTPTQEDIKDHSEFSLTTYYNKFGSFNEALKQCGFEVNDEMNISSERLITEIHRLSEEVCGGNAPRAGDLREGGEFSITAYVRCFGSWTEAVREAGFQPYSHPTGDSHPGAYTREQLSEELYRVSKEHCDGGTPSKRDMQLYGNISYQPYTREYGGWNKALIEEGYDPNNRVYIPDDELMEEMHRVSVEQCNGGSPRERDMRDEGYLSIEPYLRRFGSWNNALRNLGYSINLESERTEEELIAEIRRLAEEECEGTAPRLSDLVDFGTVSPQPYYRVFQSWDDAVEQAGFEPWEPIGEDHPNWKGGGTEYYGRSWFSQRRKAWERDHYRCRLCGKDERDVGRRPSVHHIEPRRCWNVEEEHKKMNSLDNLITLCPSHHCQLEGEWKECDHEEFEALARESRFV